MSINNHLIYEFTEDSHYLAQYFVLLDTNYKKDLDLDLEEHNMTTEVGYSNCQQKVFIIRDNGKVIAGATLNIASIAYNQLLPMEDEHFSVRCLLQNNVEQYAEIGRLVLAPSYRGKEILHDMIVKIMQHTLSLNCWSLFVMAPPLNAILYRRLCRSINTPLTVHKNLELPDKAIYRQLSLKLLSCDLRGLISDSNDVYPVQLVVG